MMVILLLELLVRVIDAHLFEGVARLVRLEPEDIQKTDLGQLSDFLISLASGDRKTLVHLGYDLFEEARVDGFEE